MYATNYFEKAFLNTMLNVSFTAPSNVYVGLFLSNPTESGVAGTEISYAGYERKEVIFSAPTKEGNTMTVKNVEQINFPVSDKDAGTITYIGIMDSKVGGNMLLYGKLTDDLILSTGEAPVLLVGEVKYICSGNLSDSYKTKLLNILRGITIAGYIPHFALFNGSPDSGGSELTGDNYSRPSIAFSTPAEQQSGQSLIQNSSVVNFNRPTTSWGVWSHSVIMDAGSSGSPVWIKEKAPAKEIKRGYMPTVGIGDCRIAIN